jgi:Cdc6-like AAA superfamily ATPase
MKLHKKFPFREDLFNSPRSHFKRHLLLEDNSRILFSGKFGIGKSFFLDHFFKEQTQTSTFTKPKFSAIHIYPINYAIASNEDVFRYIKYDVISAMLLNETGVDENDLSYIETFPDFLKKNSLAVLKTFIGMIPKIGKSINENIDSINKLIKDFLKYSSEVSSGGGDTLVDFLDTEQKKDGSLFENDLITSLIRTILIRIKEKTGNENILIIDDLDRIDPEHIFRLLNVFAAHLDDPEDLPNKLGNHYCV